MLFLKKLENNQMIVNLVFFPKIDRTELEIEEIKCFYCLN